MISSDWNNIVKIDVFGSRLDVWFPVGLSHWDLAMGLRRALLGLSDAQRSLWLRCWLTGKARQYKNAGWAFYWSDNVSEVRSRADDAFKSRLAQACGLKFLPKWLYVGEFFSDEDVRLALYGDPDDFELVA